MQYQSQINLKGYQIETELSIFDIAKKASVRFRINQ